LPLAAVLALVLALVLACFFGGAESAEAIAELPDRVCAGIVMTMFSEPAVKMSLVPLRSALSPLRLSPSEQSSQDA